MNQQRWRVRLDTKWGVVPNASITFQGRGRGVGYHRNYLFHTYKRRKISPLCLCPLTTLQDSERFWEAQCGCMCLRALWQSLARFIAQHTNGFTWIYPPTTGGALAWNNILPGPTNAADNNQTTRQRLYIFYIQQRHDEKKYTYTKTIGNKLPCSIFFFAGGSVLMTLQHGLNMVLLLFI